MSFTIQKAIPAALRPHGAGTTVAVPVMFAADKNIPVGRGSDIVVDDMLVNVWQIVPDDSRVALYFVSSSLREFFSSTSARTFVFAGRPMGNDIPSRPAYLLTGVIYADVHQAVGAIAEG